MVLRHFRISEPRRMFSLTVSCANTCRPSGTNDSPSRAMVSGERPMIDRPSSLMVPWLGVSAPAIAIIVVDLPAPFGPTSTTISPLSTRKVAPRTAAMRPYWTWMLSTSSMDLVRPRSQVGADHIGVVLDPFRRILDDGAAAVDHVDAVAYAHDDPHIVLDQEHAAAEARRDLGDQRHQVVALGVRHPGRGLVEEGEARRGRQRPADADAALVAIGQGLGPCIGLLRETHPREDALRALPRGPAVEAGAHGSDLEVLDDRHVAEQARGLEGAGQAHPAKHVRLPPGDVASAK